MVTSGIWKLPVAGEATGTPLTLTTFKVGTIEAVTNVLYGDP